MVRARRVQDPSTWSSEQMPYAGEKHTEMVLKNLKPGSVRQMQDIIGSRQHRARCFFLIGTPEIIKVTSVPSPSFLSLAHVADSVNLRGRNPQPIPGAFSDRLDLESSVSHFGLGFGAST